MDRVTFFFGGWEPVGRIVVVGSLAYLSLIVLLRVSGNRTLASMNAFDFIITVALGASFGRILTARSVALVEAVTAFALLIGLQYIVSWLKIRSARFAAAVTSPPALLFFRGRFLQQALIRHRFTEEALRTAARKEGIGSLAEVEAIILESDGTLAVIPASRAGDRSTFRHLDPGS